MKAVITGGVGFIGVNLADYLAKNGHHVVIIDNFSRKGTRENSRWLVSLHPNVEIICADIRTDSKILRQQLNKKVDVVYHLAAQVAVTTSVNKPREDFEINALGSLNVLEAARLADHPPIVFYSSTNKVYGNMEKTETVDRGQAYDYRDLPEGVSEINSLDFHSPYGCSKGSADQYFRDYARIYDLRTVVFRQSCIYGQRQFGIEDQGWVAWFAIAAFLDKEITIFGDGKQVRDVLYVQDLIQAFEMAYEQITVTAGQIYNIGGGRNCKMSLLELVEFLTVALNRDLRIRFDEWRPGDQKVYVSNCAKANQDFAWQPEISPTEGVGRLLAWVQQYQDEIRNIVFDR